MTRTLAAADAYALITTLVAAHYRIDPAHLSGWSQGAWSETGCAKLQRARRVSIYLAHVALGHSSREVAAAARVHHRTVQRAVAAVEVERERIAFDRHVVAFEEALEARRIYGRAVEIVAVSAAVPAERIARPATNADRRRAGYEPEARIAAGARSTALYLASVAGDVPMGTVARLAGISREAVRRAVAGIEDARDDPDLDAALGQLEQSLQGAAA